LRLNGSLHRSDALLKTGHQMFIMVGHTDLHNTAP
jgi:hypothetical protein